MTPEEVVAQFLGTTDTPNKPIADYGRMKMREQREAQQRAARMKAVSEYLERQKQNWPYSGEPYGQSRPDAPPAAEQSVGPMTEARRPDPNLISSALAGAPMAAIAGLMGRGAAPAIGRVAPKVAKAVFEGSRSRPWLLGGGALGAATEFLEDKPTVQGALTSGALGVADVASPPLSIAAQMLGYAPEAEAMPFHSWMTRLGVKNIAEPTALYINPTRSEQLQMLKEARQTYREAPTVRLLRDLNSRDIYGVEGSSIMHDDMRRHLGLPREQTIGAQGMSLPDLDNEIQYLRTRPVKKAGGGLVSKGLKMLFPNAAAPMHVVKPKGGNWLTGSVEGALRGLQRAPGVEREGVETFSGMSDRAIEDAKRTFAIDDWIDGPLTKYVKTRMASPEDEVRALAEQGILHFEPRGIRDNAPIMDNVVARRLMSGNPATERAVTPLGEQWERYADAAIEPKAISELSAGQIGKNLWAEKLPRNATVYGVDNWRIGSNAEENLGFDHLIDELSNALDPNSGLPRHLQLTPEAVKQMSMEKAVRRVADINAWRAEQKIAASKELADKASVVREYTDPTLPNPKGLRWVELKKNEDWYPEGWKGEPVDDLRDQQLKDQLKYEGDTMGHCVGGYCDDVASGRSRIFSLRDAKGQPHVTIETSPGHPTITLREAIIKAQQDGVSVPADEDAMMAIANKYLIESSGPSRIVQIKGKQNRKPNDEYLPFVQDFVRNSPLGGQWADVGDLQNTGLFRVRPGQKWPGFAEDMPPGFYSLGEARRLAEEKGMDPDVLEVWMSKLGSPGSQYASGGPVRTYPKPTDSPATTGTRGRSPADVVAQFLSEQI